MSRTHKSHAPEGHPLLAPVPIVSQVTWSPLATNVNQAQSSRHGEAFRSMCGDGHDNAR
jgi:hypothetical protein